MRIMRQRHFKDEILKDRMIPHILAPTNHKPDSEQPEHIGYLYEQQRK